MENKGNNNRQKRIIALIILLIVFVLDISILLVFLNGYFNLDNKSKKSDDPTYQPSVDTMLRYNNIVSYINNEREHNGKSKDIDTLIAIQYIDQSLSISYMNDKEPGYIKIDFDSSLSIDNVLNTFKESIPEIGIYTTTSIYQSFNKDKSLNINKEPIKGFISTYGVNKNYISATYKQDDNTLCSLSNALYNNDGLYEGITKITKEENQLLYEMYEYILYK